MLNTKYNFLGILLISLFFSLTGSSCGQNAINDYNTGIDLMNNGKYEEAITIFTDGINRKHIASQRSYYGRAFCYYYLEKYDLAVEDIEEGLATKTINHFELNRDLYWLQGRVADVRNDTFLELESYQKAISYDAKNSYLLSTIGLLYIELSDYKKAVEALTEAIEINEQDAYAYNNLALAYLKLDRIESAFTYLELSKRYDSENPFLYENYYFAHAAQGDNLKACEFLNIALSKDILEYGSKDDLVRMRNNLEENCNE